MIAHEDRSASRLRLTTFLGTQKFSRTEQDIVLREGLSVTARKETQHLPIDMPPRQHVPPRKISSLAGLWWLFVFW